jgi:hypothetical protein
MTVRFCTTAQSVQLVVELQRICTLAARICTKVVHGFASQAADEPDENSLVGLQMQRLLGEFQLLLLPLLLY